MNQSHYFDAYVDRAKRMRRITTIKNIGWSILGFIAVSVFWGLLLYGLFRPDQVQSTGTFPF